MKQDLVVDSPKEVIEEILETPPESTTQSPALAQLEESPDSRNTTTETTPADVMDGSTDDLYGIDGVTENIKVELPFTPMPTYENNDLWEMLNAQPFRRRKKRSIKNNDVILDSGKSYGLVDQNENNPS